ncbi:MAG: hypothetical protein KatS3mg028_1293 [Bacteroidia bacterium]|nr:MAG: hypothetical protein KatS3mg028_1293 [Bacteroidia bacterium]
MHVSLFEFVKLFLIFIFVSSIIILTGRFINRIFKIFQPKNLFNDLFYSYLIGLIIFYFSIAIIRTNGVTSYSIGFICIVFYYFSRKYISENISKNQPHVFTTTRHYYFLFLLIAFITFSLNFLFNYLSYFILSDNLHKISDGSFYFIPNDVNYYYYNLSYDIYKIGVETVHANPIKIYPSFYIPYHFTELWINGLVTNEFNLHSPVSYIFITIPLIRIGILLGLLSIVYHHTNDTIKVIFFVIIGWFISGFYYVQGKHWLLDCLKSYIHLGNIWLAPKNNIIYVFLLFLLDRYFYYRCFLSLNFLYDFLIGTILLSISYFALIPVWFSITFVLWISIVFVSIQKKQYKGILYSFGLLMIFYILSMLFIYYISPKLNEGISANNPMDFKGIIFYNPTLKLKVFLWNILKIFTMFLPFLLIALPKVYSIFRKLFNKKYLFAVVFCGLIIVIPMFISAIFIPIFNADQLFILMTIPCLNLISYIFVLSLTSVKKVIAISIIIAANFYHIFTNNISNQIKNNRIKLVHASDSFTRLINEKSSPRSNKDLYVYYSYSNIDSLSLPDGHQVIPFLFPDIIIERPHIYTFIINPKIIKNCQDIKFTNELNARIITNPFYLYSRKKKTSDFKLLTLSFIDKYKPSILISHKNDTLPSFLSIKIKDKATYNDYVLNILRYE